MNISGVIRNKCAGQITLKIHYIGTFKGLVTADSDVYFAAVHLQLKGVSNLVLSNCTDDHISACLEAHLRMMRG
jgi:hypothetical protein